MIHKILTIYLF